MSWQFDPFHTQVEFAAKHLGMMTVRGHFLLLTRFGYPQKVKDQLWIISNWTGLR